MERRNASERNRKKLQKTLKNPLTKESGCDIINKLTERNRSESNERERDGGRVREAEEPKLIEN